MFWTACNMCRLKGNKVVLPDSSTLPDGPRIIIVGEAPGADEDAAGKPFVGKAGKLLDKALIDSGVSRSEIMLTNTVLCRPPDNKLSRNESGCCRGIVEGAITHESYTETRVYVGLGGTAGEFLLGKKDSVSRTRGKAHIARYELAPKGVDSRRVVVTWHPAYALPGYRVSKEKAAEVYSQIVSDLQLAKRIAYQKRVETNYTLIQSLPDALACIADLNNRRVISYDTETTGLQHNAQLLGIAFSHSPGQSAYLPVWTYDIVRKELVRPDWLPDICSVVCVDDALRKLFLNPDVKKIGHNLKYDAQIIYSNLGVWPVSHVWDTMTAAFVENTEPEGDGKAKGRWSLENLMSKICPEILDKKHMLDQSKKALGVEDGFTKIPIRLLSQYASGDADGTLRVAIHLKNQLKNRLKDNTFYEEQMMPMTDALARAQHRGVKVDVALALEYRSLFTKEIEKVKGDLQEVAAEAGMPNWNPGSHPQKQVLFRDKWKLPKEGETDGGGFQINKTVMTKWLLNDGIDPKVREFLVQFMHYNKIAKLKSTYIDGLLKYVQPDGCVRANFNQLGTRTFRLASDEPNLQNLPRGGDNWSEKIKHLYVARPGYVFIGSDLSQAELRVAAVLSYDDRMLSVFRNGEDPHKNTSTRIYGKPVDAIVDRERWTGKTTNFAVLYGTTPPTLRATICYDQPENLQLTRELVQEHTQDKCEWYIDAFWAEYTGIARWTKDQIEFARKNGYVTTYFGGRRYLSGLDSNRSGVRKHAENQAYNTPVQGTAGLLTNRAFYHMDQQFDGRIAYPILTVHDWNCVEVAEDYVDEYKDRVLEIMTMPYREIGELIPLEADLDVGNRWKPLS